MYSRRDFGKFALASVPLSVGLAGKTLSAEIDSSVSGVRLGCSTYSYRDLAHRPGGDQTDVAIAALVSDGAGETELFSPTIEPEGRGGMRAPRNSPEALQSREALRQWRLTTPMSHFKQVGKKFSDAGVKIDAYTVNYREDYTDAEIDKTFEQAQALGTKVIATSTQMKMAERLAPFADKHRFIVALHGHSSTNDPEEFSSPETFQKGIAMSRYYKINLDIGHFSAAGFDPVAYIDQHHDQITHLHIKDRKKNDGPNEPFGQGDTPIKEVLLLLKSKKYPIPALVEYEYKGTGTPVEEVRKCMDYMRQAIA